MSDLATLQIVPAESGVLVEARSSVGHITFGSTALTGEWMTDVVDERVDLAGPMTARVVVPMSSLVSGNAMYDNELRTRLNAQRFPDVMGELTQERDLGAGRVSVSGELTLRGAACPRDRGPRPSHPPGPTRSRSTWKGPRSSTCVTDIELPKVLMLRIYPEVSLRFKVTAKAGTDPGWRHVRKPCWRSSSAGRWAPSRTARRRGTQRGLRVTARLRGVRGVPRSLRGHLADVMRQAADQVEGAVGDRVNIPDVLATVFDMSDAKQQPDE